MNITADQLSKIAHYAKPAQFASFVDPMAETMERYSINTSLRAAHFIGQVMHESGEFRYLEEIADGHAYEGRADLGNTHPGDGKRFKGRGLIQLTGRANYLAYTQSRSVDFIALPYMVAHVPYCVDVAGWYWSVKRHINPLADEDNCDAVTRAINGGLNHINERRDYLNRAKRVFAITA